MIIEDMTTLKAALATMNPTARTATHVLAEALLQDPSLIQRQEELQQKAIVACAGAFKAYGGDPFGDEPGFEAFLREHAANVLDLAVSVLLVSAKNAQRKATWGKVGKAAALVGAAALGAIFG